MPDLTLIAAVAIFAATYAFVAVGKMPVYRIDRAGAALLGASLMVGTGVLSAEEAYRAVDFDTITLLLGMMIVVAQSARLRFLPRGHGLGSRPTSAIRSRCWRRWWRRPARSRPSWSTTRC